MKPWRSWGGIQSDVDADQERARIERELRALSGLKNTLGKKVVCIGGASGRGGMAARPRPPAPGSSGRWTWWIAATRNSGRASGTP